MAVGNWNLQELETNPAKRIQWHRKLVREAGRFAVIALQEICTHGQVQEEEINSAVGGDLLIEFKVETADREEDLPKPKPKEEPKPKL